ncbi:MAG: cadherin-like beta sandwich domain-containing protein [Lachnospiraceae bacterium]|nr:cadherin-like beta sandwich domain-containing protein [Lachnospiraceae bacterium]
MSVSYDGINMVIQEKDGKAPSPSPAKAQEEERTPEPQETPLPSVAPEAQETVPSTERHHKKGDEIGSVDLKKLSVAGVELTPAFSRDIKRYSGTLNTSDTWADIKYKAADSVAEVKIKGNDTLQDGKNVIKIVVKNGENKKTYRISLNVKLLKGMDKAGSNRVTVEKVEKKTYLSGDITVEAGAVKDETLLPDDFEEVTVSIDGKEVKGYAYGGAMDQGYFLIYGKNTQSFYVYDEEKEQLLPYDQVKNWYRSMGGQDDSELDRSERKLESYRYMLGILGAFSGLMFVLVLFLVLRKI